MNAYHVLAKTSEIPMGGNCSSPTQEHFFVKAESSSQAVSLVEMRTQPEDNYQVQYTVSDAVSRWSSGMDDNEEVYSI